MPETPPETWIIPVTVYDEFTARDTAKVLASMGYIASPETVYQVDGS